MKVEARDERYTKTEKVSRVGSRQILCGESIKISFISSLLISHYDLNIGMQIIGILFIVNRSKIADCFYWW